ncbi:MAG: hypothetical protein N3F08_05770, partial [Crenarchaeota archaeon]|nr:hypothetical protein [Thermoproteota archaeon]
MNVLLEPLITMVSFLLVLLISSELAIKYIVKISELTGLGKSRVGFTFLATTTSLPELAVAFFSAISGEAAVSVGNVLGSNVANICLAIGLGLVIYSFKRSEGISAVKFKPDELDMMYLGIFTASIIPILLITFLPASQIVGLLLIIIYAYQTYKIISKRKLAIEEFKEPVIENTPQRKRILMISMVLAFLGIIGVVVSSDFIVNSTVRISLLIGVPTSLISATVIAVGTSFPEISLGIQAMLKGHAELNFGNVIGSGFTNITLILGATLLFSPTIFSIR